MILPAIKLTYQTLSISSACNMFLMSFRLPMESLLKYSDHLLLPCKSFSINSTKKISLESSYKNFYKKWWYNIQVKARKKSSDSSNTTFLKIAFGTSVALGYRCATSHNIVLCERKEGKEVLTHDRLKGIPEPKDFHEPQFSWEQFWQLLKPQLINLISAILSAFVVALSNIQIPTLLGEVVNVVAKYNRGEVPEGSNFMEDIMKPSYKIFKVYIVQSLFTFVYIAFLTRMGERMASDLRQQLFDSFLKQDIAFYDKHKAGELVNRLTADVQDFKSSFKMCISQGMRSITQIIGCGVSMYEISPSMAGWTAFFVPVIISIGAGLGGLLRSLSREAQQQVGLSTAVADECLGNMRTVRAFAMEEEESKLYSRELDKSTRLNELLGMGIGIFQAGTNLFLNGLVLGTLHIGGRMMSLGQLQPGDLMSFLVCTQTIQKSLGQLSIIWGTYIRGVSAGARVFEYINEEPEISKTGGLKIPFEELEGRVEFRNVSFAYPTRPNQVVLTDFSLSVPAGKMVAIVGVSGGGKSTLAQLLERFYDVAGGSITIDGVDIRTLNPSWMRGRVIGFINQEPILFATSVLENIRYGRPDASDVEVMEAAKLANADGFIQKFPRGYDTVVGERGVTISGGQRQRIAIARALIKDPRILVLDEATSALDAESESVVQNALDECVSGRTTIVIAHRLSTIQNADLIAVMSQGRLVELGTHSSLKKLGGIYAELIKQQQKDANLQPQQPANL